MNVHISAREACESGGIPGVTREGAERGERCLGVTWRQAAPDDKDKLAHVEFTIERGSTSQLTCLLCGNQQVAPMLFCKRT